MRKVSIIVLWAVSLFGAYRAGHIVSNRYDYTPPANVRAAYTDMPTNHWTHNMRFRPFGRFVLMRPADPKEAALFIGVFGHPPFPAIWIADDAKAGRPDEFTFADAATNSITALDTNHDGVFEALFLFTTNGAYRDRGLTGTWQHKRAE